MCKKLLVHITINIWEKDAPEVTTEEVVRETEKSLYVVRTVHPHSWRYNEKRSVEREVPIKRSDLGKISSHQPGVMKCHLLLPAGADVKFDPELGRVVQEMTSACYTILDRACKNAAAIRDWIEE